MILLGCTVQLNDKILLVICKVGKLITPNALNGIRFVIGRNFGVVERNFGVMGEGLVWGLKGYFTLMPCVNLGYTNF